MNALWPPPIAVSAAFWGNPSGENLEPWLAEMRSLGFMGVTLFVDFYVWGRELGNGSALAISLATEGMQLASIVTGVHVDLDRYRRLADAIAQAGGRHMVVIGGEGRSDVDRARLADSLNEIGRIAQDRTVIASYHHHTDTAGESFADVTALLAATDPTLIGLTFDVGHATKDFDALELADRTTRALDAFWGRIALVELKDWRPDGDLDTPFGEGLAKGAEVLDALRRRGYAEWLIVEQNDELGRSVEEKKACAARSFAFVSRVAGVHAS